ncbi:Hypothetical predicted protein [Octopus vulgaris]|uniref:Uncharacterized protein n=1 Tax=Octopus vulgaris TaxID=6645 RepID=A0AA36AWA5_OCTVU|nr:Hypothetical predicted protein [Octopus vulgaris]
MDLSHIPFHHQYLKSTALFSFRLLAKILENVHGSLSSGESFLVTAYLMRGFISDLAEVVIVVFASTTAATTANSSDSITIISATSLTSITIAASIIRSSISNFSGLVVVTVAVVVDALITAVVVSAAIASAIVDASLSFMI